MSSIFDGMTPDDIRILIETEDEYARKGNFQRLFPSLNSKKYMKYFEKPRYHNILLSHWTERYKENSTEGLKIYSTNQLKLFSNLFCLGISLLNSYCKKKVHFQNPATSFENQVNERKLFIKRKKMKILIISLCSGLSIKHTRLI